MFVWLTSVKSHLIYDSPKASLTQFLLPSSYCNLAIVSNSVIFCISGWFKDMSKLFLSAPVSKLLVLAGRY